MKSGKSMISHQMLRELLLRLQYEFQDYPAAFQDFWWSVGFPGVICLLVAAVLGFLVLRIKRMFFMTPIELHREALTLLCQQHGPKEKEGEQLLQRAIAMNYMPARISLAALYAYRQGRPEDALRLLSTSGASLNQDGKGIRLDALAVKAGNGNMIQAELRALEFLSIAYADVVEVPEEFNDVTETAATEPKKEK